MTYRCSQMLTTATSLNSWALPLMQMGVAGSADPLREGTVVTVDHATSAAFAIKVGTKASAAFTRPVNGPNNVPIFTQMDATDDCVYPAGWPPTGRQPRSRSAEPTHRRSDRSRSTGSARRRENEARVKQMRANLPTTDEAKTAATDDTKSQEAKPESTEDSSVQSPA